MRMLLLLLAAAGVCGAQPAAELAARIAAHGKGPELAPGQAMGDDVEYAPGRHGFLYMPAGKGPFPSMLWNHGSEQKPGWQPELAAFYNAHGYVFFIPHRRGHGRSPGEYIVDRNRKIESSAGNAVDAERAMVALHEEYLTDVAAAVEWLKKRPQVDARRIVMSGCSFGGIQTLLASEKGMGVRAFVPFAPAAMSWRMRQLRARLLQASRNGKAPVFLIQARNDYSLGPSEVLGPEIRKRNPANRAKVYPSFGPEDDHRLGHAGFACWNLGTEIWGPEVLAFLTEAMR